MAEPLRVLILGQSNSGGVLLADSTNSWPELFARGLPAVIGGPAELTLRPFFAHAPGATAYLERELSRHAPNVVILMVTTFSFSTPVVEPELRRRFGRRAGDIYRMTAENFDRFTRFKGGAPASINRGVRAAMVRMLGAKPVTSYETALGGTTEALQRLAREEDIEVVAFHGFVPVKRHRDGRLSVGSALVERFLAEVGDAAGALRIPFLNMQRLAGSIPSSWFYPDGVHVTPEAHAAVAAFALNAFRSGLIGLSTHTEGSAEPG